MPSIVQYPVSPVTASCADTEIPLSGLPHIVSNKDPRGGAWIQHLLGGFMDQGGEDEPSVRGFM